MPLNTTRLTIEMAGLDDGSHITGHAFQQLITMTASLHLMYLIAFSTKFKLATFWSAVPIGFFLTSSASLIKNRLSDKGFSHIEFLQKHSTE